jgi:hypothetical protein
MDSQTFQGEMSMATFDNQRVPVSTTQTRLNQNGSIYHYAAPKSIISNAGSKLRLMGLSSSRVLFELDANGDGVYEKSDTRLWNSLH